MRRKFVALDDPELNSWLLELIADPSPSFLSALAEAVLTANLEDYAIVRPCLIRFRKKYRRETTKTLIHKERPVQYIAPTEVPDLSRANPRRVALTRQIRCPRIAGIEFLVRRVITWLTVRRQHHTKRSRWS